MWCDGEMSIILSVIKSLYAIIKFIVPLFLIVSFTIELFKIVIAKNDDEKKKCKKLIFNRLLSAVMLFLVPSFVFFVLGTLFSNNISDIDLIRNCWNLI